METCDTGASAAPSGLGRVTSGWRNPASPRSQDFEVNLTPIVDCLTVLIAFVMISISFFSVGILDAGIAAGGEKSNAAKPSPINVTITLSEKHEIGVAVKGASNRTVQLEPRGGEWNYEGLTRELSGLKTKWPDLGGATLLADNNVSYRDVIKAMDVGRKAIPTILLGGF